MSGKQVALWLILGLFLAGGCADKGQEAGDSPAKKKEPEAGKKKEKGSAGDEVGDEVAVTGRTENPIPEKIPAVEEQQPGSDSAEETAKDTEIKTPAAEEKNGPPAGDPEGSVVAAPSDSMEFKRVPADDLSRRLSRYVRTNITYDPTLLNAKEKQVVRLLWKRLGSWMGSSGRRLRTMRRNGVRVSTSSTGKPGNWPP